MGSKDQRFGFPPRFFQVVNILLQPRFLQAIADGAGRGGGDIVVNLPGCVAPGIDAFMQRVADINDLITFIFQPGIDRALDHNTHGRQQDDDH